MRKGHGKCIWMDEREVTIKIKDGKSMMNGRQEYERYVRKWYGWSLPPV